MTSETYIALQNCYSNPGQNEPKAIEEAYAKVP